MTTTAEHSIAAIGLNAYWHERNLIILLLIARLNAFQGGSCCVKPTAVLHLTIQLQYICNVLLKKEKWLENRTSLLDNYITSLADGFLWIREDTVNNTNVTEAHY